MTVSELGERALLERIRTRLPRPGPGIVVGVGDDAAVVTGPRKGHTVLTTDALVEGVHFDRRYSRPADIGHKAMAVNLSDLAAMGATPAWALLSLGLPDGTLVEDVEALIDGLVVLATAQKIAVVGGNLTRSPGPLFVDVMAIGSVLPRRVLTRDGGRAGDALYLSGTIGRGVAGLEMLRAGLTADCAPASGSGCIVHYLRPSPRVRLGRAIGQARAARAAMDVSDGLADAVRRVAEASGCGAEIDAALLPIDPGARDWWVSRGQDPVVAAMAGGDDYELLIAVPPAWRGRLRHAQRRVADPELTRIGVLTRRRGEYVVLHQGRSAPLPGGFEHW